MFGRLKGLYQRHLKAFSALFTLVVVVIWLLGPVFLDLLNLPQAMALSMAILLVMLGVVQEFLNDLIEVGKLDIDASQSESNRSVMRALINKKIERVQMVEYDGESVKPLIFFLEKGAQVHCLLQHPDSAINESQRRRSIFQIMTRHEEYLGYEDKIRFSYYRDTASVRGRRVDDTLLSLGWYSYDRRPGVHGRQVWGHNNPVILTEPNVPEGQVLCRFFDTVFANLLANSETWEELASRYELLIRSKRTRERAIRMRFGVDLAAVDTDYALPNNVSLSVVKPDGLAAVPRAQLLPMIAAAFDDRDWTEELLAERVLTEGACRAAILARDTVDGGLVGFVSVHTTADPAQAKLHWLVVEAGWRGRGVGRCLVKQACRAAASDGYVRMTLRTEEYRVAAISLYRALGFDESAEPEPAT